jgi:hypothetical protein
MRTSETSLRPFPIVPGAPYGLRGIGKTFSAFLVRSITGEPRPVGDTSLLILSGKVRKQRQRTGAIGK